MKNTAAKTETITIPDTLRDIGERLRTQDNRATADPIFLLQIKVRETGFDSSYADNSCWWNPGNLWCVYDDDPEYIKESCSFELDELENMPKGEGWEGPFGYKERWETVGAFFTLGGLEEHMELNGHNVKRQAFRGEWRSYVDYLNRNPEMVEIRNWLMSLTARNVESPE